MKGFTKKIRRLRKLAARNPDLNKAMSRPMRDVLSPSFSVGANPTKMIGYLQIFQMYRHYQRNIDEELFGEFVLPRCNSELRKLTVHLGGILGFLKQKEERRRSSVRSAPLT